MDAQLTNRDKWIDAGYALFSEVGPAALNVEKLSLIVNLNRSSFYHYFGEVGRFEEILLASHVDKFESMVVVIKACEKFIPDFFSALSNLTTEFKFHRQLLIHEKQDKYREAYEKAKVFTEPLVHKLWLDHCNLHSERHEEFRIYETVRDYCLLHFDQWDIEKITEVIEDIKLALNLRESK